MLKNYFPKVLVICVIVFFSLHANAQQTSLSLAPGIDLSLPPGAVVPLIIENSDSSGMTRANVLNAQWTVNGHSPDKMNALTDGKLSIDPKDILREDGVANYTVPEIVSDTETIAIAVSVQQPITKEKDILFCYVHVNKRPNIFSVGSIYLDDAKTFVFKEPMLSSQRKMFETAMFINNQWNVMVSGHDDSMNTLGITLSFVGNSTGTYPWKITWTSQTGVIPPSTTASVTCSSPLFQLMSINCVPNGDPNCKTKTSNGTTTITKFNTKTKQMEGYFEGQMYDGKEYECVSGAFSVFINQ